VVVRRLTLEEQTRFAAGCFVASRALCQRIAITLADPIASNPRFSFTALTRAFCRGPSW
jgi:hypothetical protein